MKMVKRLFMIFVMVLLQNTLSAQTNNATSASTVNQELQVENTSTQNSTSLLTASQDASEPIPTPEQQGFTKVLVEGKSVYYKKVDGVLIEYKPE